jgi:hypothetical protein
MEKICTRCSFRNPGGRGVCQVCGYSKFVPMADAQMVVAKEGGSVVNETVNGSSESLSAMFVETKVAVVNALHKIGALVMNRPVKQADVVEANQPVRVLSDSFKSVSSVSVETFEDNDLDSMIAWFKSYGVDRPLILEPAPAKVAVRNNTKAA